MGSLSRSRSTEDVWKSLDHPEKEVPETCCPRPEEGICTHPSRLATRQECEECTPNLTPPNNKNTTLLHPQHFKAPQCADSETQGRALCERAPAHSTTKGAGTCTHVGGILRHGNSSRAKGIVCRRGGGAVLLVHEGVPAEQATERQLPPFFPFTTRGVPNRGPEG
mgnify:CR=1 FL=1